MNATEPILVLDGVYAGYGKMTILNGTSARVRRGAITTVIGPNGAGKSTLFKTIFGLLPVRSGTITLDGRDTTNFSPRDILDAGVAYVPQGRNIFPELSVLAQSRARRRRARRPGEPAGPHRQDHAAVSDAARTRPTRKPRRCRAASRKCWKSRAGCCSIPSCS